MGLPADKKLIYDLHLTFFLNPTEEYGKNEFRNYNSNFLANVHAYFKIVTQLNIPSTLSHFYSERKKNYGSYIIFNQQNSSKIYHLSHTYQNLGLKTKV